MTKQNLQLAPEENAKCSQYILHEMILVSVLDHHPCFRRELQLGKLLNGLKASTSARTHARCLKTSRYRLVAVLVPRYRYSSAILRTRVTISPITGKHFQVAGASISVAFSLHAGLPTGAAEEIRCEMRQVSHRRYVIRIEAHTCKNGRYWGQGFLTSPAAKNVSFSVLVVHLALPR